MSNQRIASREWHTRVIVRVLQDATRSNAYHRQRTFHAGEELEMIQWGRAGRRVDRDVWWTDFDIDGAYIIPADKVKVVKVIDEVTP